MQRVLFMWLVFVFGLGIGVAYAEESMPLVRMATITVTPGQRDAFIAHVTEGMRQAVAKEPGVLGLYCVAIKDNPDQLLFVEIYADEQAYQKHIKTPHFQTYIQRTKDLVRTKELVETEPIALIDKRGWGKP